MVTDLCKARDYQNNEITMAKKYEIRADAKMYSEWEVDDNGKLTYQHHEFEGADLINYKIIDISEDSESDDPVFESESFEETKKELNRLNK